MATAVSTIGTVNRAPLSLNGSRSSASVPSSTFLGSNLKKVNSRFTSSKVSSGSLRIIAEVEEERQTNKDKWRGLAFDTSDDQQDITRGKGMVDSLFQAPQGAGTHFAITAEAQALGSVFHSQSHFVGGVRRNVKFSTDNVLVIGGLVLLLALV